MRKQNKLLTNILVTLFGKFGTMAMQMITTIILARFLEPNDFGIVAMCTIFLSISEMLIDSGMASSILYYNDVKEKELHTVFWTNIFIGLLIYLFLYFCSGYVAIFYEVQILEPIIKVIGLSIVLHSFCLLHSALISKDLMFKLQNKILLLSGVSSSITVVCLAFFNFGIWALVAQPILLKIYQVFFYNFYSTYKPKLQFSRGLLSRHWSFGSKLLVSSFLKLIYDNIYIQVIGKIINIRDAGYYSQAKRFNDIPTRLIAFPLERVIFPDLVKSNNMLERMEVITKYFTLLVIPLLLLGSLISEDIILILLGEKWIESGWMLSYLFIGGVGLSLEALTRSFIKASGNISILLKFDIYKRMINLFVLVIGLNWGMEGILITFIINGILGSLVNSYALSISIDCEFRTNLYKTLKVLMISLVPYITILFFFKYNNITNCYLSFIVKIILFFAILLPLVFIFKREIVNNILNKVRK